MLAYIQEEEEEEEDGDEESMTEAGESSLDDVTPSSELARAEIATMASNIIDLIANLKTSCSLARSSVDKALPVADDHNNNDDDEEEHIYEEIANDSATIHLHDMFVRPPPLPERRVGRGTATTLPREFPPILRKKKLPSKHRDACVRWKDEVMTFGSLRRLTGSGGGGGRKVATAVDDRSGRTETKDFLTMPAQSSIRPTFA